MKKLNMLTLMAACSLAGCAGDGQMPGLGSILSGDRASPRSTAKSETAVPAKAALPARSAATPGSRIDAPETGSIKLGRKQITLASVELDRRCSRLVAPFEYSANLDELAGVAADNLGSSAAKWLENSLTGSKQATKSVATGARHDLAASMRHTAVRMNWLPMSWEVLYGEHYHNEMKDELLGRDERLGRKLYPKADAILAEILAKLDQPSPYEFKLYIRTTSGSNAMALPGGFLYLDKALVAKTELRDKAYFALAHEIAHVLQRHETRALQARIVDAVSLKDVMDTLRKARDKNQGAAVISTVLTGKLLFEKHSEVQELQADACTVRLLHDCFQDKSRLVRAIQGFLGGLPKSEPARKAPASATEKNQQAIAEIVDMVSRPIDRHPSTEERKQNLGLMLAEVRKPAGNQAASGARKKP